MKTLYLILIIGCIGCNGIEKEENTRVATTDTISKDTLKKNRPAPNPRAKNPQRLTTSEKGADLIKSTEAFAPNPYPGNNCTLIGYGCIIDLNKNPEYRQGIDKTEADRLLRKELKKVEKTINKKVKVPLKQHEFDALASFTYSTGIGRFGKSTLLKKINSNAPDKEIRAEFMRWTKSAGKTLPGLIKRREAEADMFINGH